jgi:hypothetical protein
VYYIHDKMICSLGRNLIKYHVYVVINQVKIFNSIGLVPEPDQCTPSHSDSTQFRLCSGLPSGLFPF